MLLAFAWWSFLLFSKNRDAFLAKSELNKIGMIANGLVQNDEEYRQTDFFKELESKYKRQEWMILGEAAVFVISLVIGVWMINQGYNKEIDAVRQRRNFLLSITHELKSPLASIKLILETFRKRNLGTHQIHQLSSNALEETNRLHDLVNDLLLAAKMEATYTLNQENINLTNLLEELNIRLGSKYPEVKFEFRKPESPLIIQGDLAGITSVVVNLLENSVKYGAENPKVSTVLRQGKESIWIEFADNGIGIPDKEKNKIFDRFYRVGSEDTRKTKGTGLGLYIVKQVVLAHKGTIEVSDNRPRGTIFTIALPKGTIS